MNFTKNKYWLMGALLLASLSSTGYAQSLNLNRTFSGVGYGSPIDLEDNYALIGRRDGAGGADLVDVTTGQVLTEFPNPNPGPNFNFPGDFYAWPGHSTVDYSSGLVLIGASTEDLAANDSGAAYLFDAFSGDLIYTFTHPDPIPDFGGAGFGQGFGREVALHGDFALIGSIAREAFLFDVTTGQLVRSFEDSTTGLFGFGEAVALSSDYVAIADPSFVDTFPSAGAVHVYELTSGTLVRSFYNPTPDAYDFFGQEIAISGDRILIGAGQVDHNGLSNSGEAYLFEISTGALLQTFTDPTPEDASFFGRHVAIDNNQIAISSDLADEVHVFDAVSGELLQTLSPPVVLGVFGRSLSINQDRLLVGSGSTVYLYSEESNQPPIADAGPDRSSPVGQVVLLNGTLSSDPNGDELSFLWQVESSPPESSAQPTHPLSAISLFIPDVPGSYVLSLTVDDQKGGTDADLITIDALTNEEAALALLAELLAIIDSTADDAFKTKGNRQAFTNLISQAIATLESGNIKNALHKIESARSRTDGCIIDGSPDSNGPQSDWVINCSTQPGFYFRLNWILSIQ